MKRIVLNIFVVTGLVLLSSNSFAEWVTNDGFPLIGDSNAKKGGEIRYAVTSYPSTFRTHGPGTTTYLHSLMSSLVYQNLLGIHSNTLDFIPDLAEAWDIQADNMTFLFRLNPKARWEDGKPVTSEDVVFSWELITDPNTKDPYSADLFRRRFEKPEVIDQQTVKFIVRKLLAEKVMLLARRIIMLRSAEVTI